MRVKVCGMKYHENINAIQNCKPDFLGFIFYAKSPRYVIKETLSSLLILKGGSKKVGVFVNESIGNIVDIVKKYELDFVQLHGDEPEEYVKELFNLNIKLIKAFQIKEDFDWAPVKNYVPYVHYFLFDTATKHYGGSGLKFNWKQLKNYKEKIPFFLSGGITVNDVQEIKNIDLAQLYAIDINSGFEVEPGMKEVILVKTMINDLRNESTISSK